MRCAPEIFSAPASRWNHFTKKENAELKARNDALEARLQAIENALSELKTREK